MRYKNKIEKAPIRDYGRRADATPAARDRRLVRAKSKNDCDSRRSAGWDWDPSNETQGGAEPVLVAVVFLQQDTIWAREHYNFDTGA